MISRETLEVFEMMFGGMGWGAGTFFGPIFMILFWVLVIAGTVWLVLAVSGRAGQRLTTPSSSSRAILEDRLARGEIDIDEFNARKSAIGGAS